MAANSYTLTMTDITLSAITIAVGGRDGAAADLAKADIKIKKFNGATFDNFDAFSLDDDPAPTKTTAIILPTVAFGQSDLILIQIDDGGAGTTLSDRVMVDFAEDYDAGNHDATYKYEVPAQTGSYKMQLDTVNGNTTDGSGDEFNLVESAEFTVGNAPDKDNCSISIAKDYLVKYTGQVLDLTVVINNGDGSVPAGNYEVSIDADLQP